MIPDTDDEICQERKLSLGPGDVNDRLADRSAGAHLHPDHKHVTGPQLVEEAATLGALDKATVKPE